jgi:DNA repair exonuclease SbcCD ATPase subunit
MADTTIRFPVLKRLNVSGYQLFPGTDGTGIDHAFERGVTVVVGINGLGKTTLLNIILRSLLGFYTPSKFDPYDPVSGSHKMVEKETDYFTSRTTNLAKDARVDAEFAFGSDRLKIMRRLDTLDIQGLFLNGEPIEGEQHELQHEIVKASGLATLYDFFYVVRSFTFFLEDKVSLIWNPSGQFEIFRILFFDPTKAKEFAELADAIKRKDSKYRNLRVYYNKAMEELNKTEARTGNTSTAAEELRLKRVDVNTLEESDSAIRRRLEKALLHRTSLLEQIQKMRLELEEDRRQQEGLLDSFFSRAFPDLPDVVANILNHLDGDHGCLVCGTPNPKRRLKFRELANQGVCPFCETKNVRTEKVGALSARADEEIKQLDARIEEKRKNLSILEDGLKKAHEQVDAFHAERAANSSKLLAAQGEAERLEATLPPSQEELDKKRKQLDNEGREMKHLRLEIAKETKRYSTLLAEGRKSIEKMAAKLTKRFEYYAGEFLAEKCKLAYREEKRRLGEEGELLNYPNFHVSMTSAVSPRMGTPRTEDTQVSESQKEFVDLAFRMALFDAVRQAEDGVMLVIETPEASLDSIFVRKAGDLLRKFAEDGAGEPNVIIASCNLNGTGIVRSLLGVGSLNKRAVREDVPKKIINLLELAAPNAAVRQDRKTYQAELEAALKK